MSFPSHGHRHALLRVFLCCAPILRMAAGQPCILLHIVHVTAGCRKNSCFAGSCSECAAHLLCLVHLLSCPALRFKTPKALPSTDAEMDFPLPQSHAVALCMYGSCAALPTVSTGRLLLGFMLSLNASPSAAHMTRTSAHYVAYKAPITGPCMHREGSNDQTACRHNGKFVCLAVRQE